MNLETPLKKVDAHKRDRIAASLRKMVDELEPGDRLPSATEMRQQFGVAAGTVEAAIELLRQEGIIERRRGSGTFVAQRMRTPVPGKVDSGLIAVLASGKFPYTQNCIEQLSQQALAQGLRVVCHYGEYESNPQRALEDAQELEKLNPAGFVLTFGYLAPIAQQIWDRGYPAVIIGQYGTDQAALVPRVDGDHEHGAFLAAQHLIDLGHHRLLFVHGFDPAERLYESRRWEGHRRALEEAGITDVRAAHIDTYRPNLDAIRALFTGPHAPTGAVVWNDDAAVKLMALLRQIGLSVPEDVSVVGYGNVSLGEHAHPPLDTIDQHMEVQVRYALSTLKKTIVNPETGSGATTSVTPTLLRRSSSAAPRPASPAD